MRMLKKVALLSALSWLGWFSHGLAFQDVETVHLYASMTYNDLEGEYVGLEVAVVAYYGGTAILWRSANGHLDKPLLLDAKKDGNSLTVVVPEPNQLDGVWHLQITSKSLLANGPRGLHFNLQQIVQK